MALSYVDSQKSKKLLQHNGFIYSHEKIMKDKIIWKCTQYYSSECRGRCHTVHNNIVEVGNHNHVPDPTKIEVVNAVNAMKVKAAATNDTPQNIVCDVAAQCSKSVSAQLPKFTCLKKTIRRARHKENSVPIAPTSLEELKIPLEYTSTTCGAQFLLHDSGPSNERILIFSTLQNLTFLKNCKHWFADGTFKTSPLLFCQIYTIHGIKRNINVPAVYALLPTKEERIYVRLLTELKVLMPGLSPETIMIDFEKAAINAFQISFPTASIRGCFFHFSQCLWRKIQEAALQTRYATDSDFGLEIRKLAALAFVHEDDVIDSFDIVVDSDFFREDSILPVLDYFEDTWIGRPNRNGRRREPVFPISMWNCFCAVVDGLPRTNNAIEGWHRHFSSLLGAQHPSLWKLLEHLKKEQSLTETKMEQLIAGREEKRIKKYEAITERLINIVQEYGNIPVEEYLRGIAHNLSLQI